MRETLFYSLKNYNVMHFLLKVPLRFLSVFFTCKDRKIVLFRLLGHCKRRKDCKVNFTLKSSSNKNNLFRGEGATLSCLK